MRGGFKTCQHHQAGCFARAGRPKHCQKLAFWHGQVQIFDDQCFAVIGFLNAVKFDERRVVRRMGQVASPVCYVCPVLWTGILVINRIESEFVRPRNRIRKNSPKYASLGVHLIGQTAISYGLRAPNCWTRPVFRSAPLFQEQRHRCAGWCN